MARDPVVNMTARRLPRSAKKPQIMIRILARAAGGAVNNWDVCGENSNPTQLQSESKTLEAQVAYRG